MAPTGGPTIATLSGPSAGTVGVPSSDFTITLDHPAETAGVNCVITDSVSNSEITDTPVVISNGEEIGTFTVTPGTTGNRTITLASTSPSLTIVGSPRSYNSVEAGVATEYTFTGPPTAPIGAASMEFTIAPKTTPVLQSDGTYLDSGAYTGTITITDSRDNSHIDYSFSDAMPQTFSVTATNDTPFTLVPTSDPQLGTDPPSLTITGQTLETINSGWLSTNAQNQGGGPGPWYLTNSDTYYRLTTNATTAGTAFIVLAANVTLDLNGNTVTYNNNTPPGVANGGFEDDIIGSTTITGWDVSGAPGAIVAAAIVGMWGDNMLLIPTISPSNTVTIISDPITIPIADGVVYNAVCQPVVYGGSFTSEISVIDVDASPPTVIASYALSSPNSATNLYCEFTPTTTNRVSLKVQITAGSNTISARFDHADITRSREYGVVATRSPWGLPTYLNTTTVSNNAPGISNSVIINGTITDGSGRCWNSSPLIAWWMHQTTIDGIAMTSWSGSGHVVDGSGATDFSITNCNLVDHMDIVDDRMNSHGMVFLSTTRGTINVSNNSMSGMAQNGILLVRQTGDTYNSVTIEKNVITLESSWTDSYGIGFGAVINFSIAYNTIIPVSGRGLYLDGIGTGAVHLPTYNGTVHDNYMEAREMGNLEYGASGPLEATALRMRAGTMYDIAFSNNVFAGYTQESWDWACIGARISAYNLDHTDINTGDWSHANDNSNLLFKNNLFKAIVVANDPSISGGSQAWGMTLNRIDPGTGLTFRNNTFASNVTPLNVGDNDCYNGDEHDVSFISNIVKKVTDEGALPDSSGMRTFHSIAMGDWSNHVSNIRLIDMEYLNGATSTVGFVGQQACSYQSGYTLTLTVLNSDSTPCLGAVATVLDNSSNTVWPLPMPNPAPNPFVTTTDSNGELNIYLPVTLYSNPGNDPLNTTATAIGPFSISVLTPNNYAATQTSYAMTGDQSLTLTTDGIG